MKGICSKSCAVATVLGGGSIFCMMNARKKNVMDDFKNSLDKAQKEKYKEITTNRKNIYCRGMLLGLVLSAVLLVYKRKTLFSLNTICLTIAVLLTSSYLYYMVSPKGDYMLTHLETKEKRDKWLAIYRVMQYNYHLGLVLGICAVVVASQIMCK